MIETDRLILRHFRAEDAADVFEYLKEPMVNCFACMKVHSLEEAKKAVLDRAEDTEYTFAIVLKDTGKVIGEIPLVWGTSLEEKQEKERTLLERLFGGI